EEIICQSNEASPEHPYLKKKHVQPHGLRQISRTELKAAAPDLEIFGSGDLLVVPLQDTLGKLWSVQFITDGGDKVFLEGGRVEALYFPIGEIKDRGIICEGFASGATDHEATGHAVFCAMNAGNLPKVANAQREKHPAVKFTIAADHDKPAKNSGIRAGEKFGREAALAIGARFAMPPVEGMDFNDLAKEKGLEAVCAEFDSALKTPAPESNSAETESVKILIEHEDVDLLPGVPTPNSLFDGPPVSLDLPDLPKLEPSFFPSWLGNMISAVSEATETPPELAGLLGLAVVATCVQGKVVVSPSPGYREPLSIFVAPALDSGNRKTAVLNEMTRPLRDWEREQAEELQPEVDRATSERKTLEARIDYLRKEAAKKKMTKTFEELVDEIAEIDAKLPEVPSIPRLWTQDVTPERLGPLMAENGERISILSDEGGICETMAGRYSSGIPNLDLFLQGHAGSAVRVDRGSRPPVHLQSPTLTVALSPQTDVIRGLGLKPGFRGRGLLARILYALPTSPLGYRKLESKPISQSIRAEYSWGLRNLLKMLPATDEDGKPVPHVIEYSEDAYQEWHEFSLMVEREMRDEGKFDQINDWASKLPGAAARIAGLFHCVENAGSSPFPNEISPQTIKRALDIAAILSEHALAAFGLMGADPAIEGAKKVWRWVERTQSESFKARDCFQALKGSFRLMKELQPALDVLVERAYLAKIPQENSGKVGRTSSASYCVNPSLTEDWA
ncbi:MAG: DUF3987 domain-containing protein, partial [Nitrospinaceae bacterium]|nr:DUF3987 domain-containing protein [Nitrospinaceae bacterium]